MMININTKRPKIKSWKKFAKEVRSKGCNLLKELDKFQNAVLVSGCQRSGTTMLARIIFQSEGMVNYWAGRDDELDAALILSGYVEHEPIGRYCFQTTYLNECFIEYFEHETNYKLIWVLRNPYSIVYSLVHNWKLFALNELFKGCGATLLNGVDKVRYEKYGNLLLSKLKKACLSYNGKTSQIFTLKRKLPSDRLLVIDYDHLISEKYKVLPAIFNFIDLKYDEAYLNKIHTKSLTKANELSQREHKMIEQLCIPIYEKAKNLI